MSNETRAMLYHKKCMRKRRAAEVQKREMLLVSSTMLATFLVTICIVL